MARKNRTRAIAAIDMLNASVIGAVADLLETIVATNADEDIADMEGETRSAKRVKKDEKPAKKVRKPRKAKDEDDEDEKPARRTRKAKAEAFEELTVDDVYDFLENFEGEPVEGTLTELKAEVKKLGGDVDAIIEAAEDDSKAARVAELGLFIAAMKELKAKLRLHDEDEISELADELGIETKDSWSKNRVIKAILADVAAPDTGEEVEDDEEDEEEDEKPARKPRKAKAEKKSSKKSKAKAKDEDEDEDEEDDDDDLTDLDDLD